MDYVSHSWTWTIKLFAKVPAAAERAVLFLLVLYILQETAFMSTLDRNIHLAISISLIHLFIMFHKVQLPIGHIIVTVVTYCTLRHYENTMFFIALRSWFRTISKIAISSDNINIYYLSSTEFIWIHMWSSESKSEDVWKGSTGLWDGHTLSAWN